MSEILNLFKTLSDEYSPNIFWENVEALYEKEYRGTSKYNVDYDNDKNKENENHKKESVVTTLNIVERALTDPGFIDILQEICSILRSLRNEVTSGYRRELDNWENLIKVINRDSFLSIVYTLAGLPTLDPSNVQFVKLSITVIDVYFLSLTIPGAKAFHIFHEDIIAHCLKIFTIPERLQNPDVVLKTKYKSPSEIWIPFKILLDDMKTLLRYVHFSEYAVTRTLLIQRIIGLQYLNYDKGFANNYLIDLHNYCFDLYDLMINSNFGEPQETILEILNASALLHTYSLKPKSQVSSLQSNNCQHISDWFVKKISSQPSLMQTVLQTYIKAIITNPEKSWKTEQIQKAMDYAAKYDAALFRISNVSCVDFLARAAYAEEVGIRSRAVDLMSRILQLESNVDWQMFRHEISDVPREVFIIKELIEILEDSNNSIKAKAVQALYTGLTKGSPNTRRILEELVLFTKFRDAIGVIPCEPPVQKNEIRYSKPVPLKPEVSFKGFEIVEEIFASLPKLLFKNVYRNNQAYVRRSGIMLIEELIKLNPLIIFNTAFVEETARMVVEPSALVRKQMMISIDNILEKYPNCYPVIWAWCKIFSPMLSDADPKNVEIAISCFHKRVLLNVRSFDQSTKAEHFMPWAIIRTLLLTQNRYYLQNQFNVALKASLISDTILKTVESHLVTTNATEAWVLLNFLTSKVKRADPDTLLRAFLTIDSCDKEEINLFLALEVLTNCIENFSHASLNLAFKHLHKSIKDGTLSPPFISNAFNLLLKIDVQNIKSKKANECTDGDWIKELHAHLEDCLLEELMIFPDDGQKFISHLNSYTEINVQTHFPPNQNIVDFVFFTLDGFIEKFDDIIDWENIRNLNAMIATAARFALRDAAIARQACSILTIILKKADRESIVQTIIVSLKDICRKQTQIFENIMHHVLQKLESKSQSNRLVTFQCFESLILEDQVKLRGNLLLAMLSCTLEDRKKLPQIARSFFAEYLSKKDANLFSKCLMECPYVLNAFKGFGEKSSNFDNTSESPLIGEHNRSKRELLYTYLMEHVDDIFLTSYFDRLKILSQKCKTDQNMKTPEGIGLVKDVFFILTMICDQQNAKLTTTETTDEEELDTSLDMIQEQEPIQKPTSSGNSNTNGSGTGAGRGRRRQITTTMNDALLLVEKSLVCIPPIYDILKEFDNTLKASVDRLCCAIVNRFPNYAEYAQPAAFWEVYKKKALLKMKEVKKKDDLSLNSVNIESDSEDNISNTEADDEEEAPLNATPDFVVPSPTASKKNSRKRKRSSSED